MPDMHPIRLALVCAILGTAGCTTTQATTALADGQLACAARSAVVAMATVTGQPILARGASSAAVQAVCAAIGGIAVSPPAGGVAGTVTVALPASLVLPLG